MRYKAILDCTDIGGRYFKRGEIADLPEGKHSSFLIPLDEPAEASEAPEETQEPAEEEVPKTTAKSKSAKK